MQYLKKILQCDTMKILTANFFNRIFLYENNKNHMVIMGFQVIFPTVLKIDGREADGSEESVYIDFLMLAYWINIYM